MSKIESEMQFWYFFKKKKKRESKNYTEMIVSNGPVTFLKGRPFCAKPMCML